MPELPEVESLRLSLLPFIKNQRILKTEIKLPKLVSGRGTKRISSNHKKDEFVSGVTGERILTIKRRAKNLMIELTGDKLILVHLKMTGQLVFKPNKGKQIITGGHPIQDSEKELPHKHTYIIFELENGNLYYNDVRQFGYVLYYAKKSDFEKENHFKDLGVEPLEEFGFESFYKEMKAKTGSLKQVFLDQKIVVGLGNIYADEVSFKAGVRPMRKANKITKKEYRKIYDAIKEIMPKAVAMGGSSVANYLLADGSRGNYAREHKVYARAGKECLVCGNILLKTVIGSRTTVYCKVCQK
jgi:formamidopyrimidine-DNA glycosylase